MNAHEKDCAVIDAVRKATGASLNTDDARTLRRAAKVLHRWAALGCGTSPAHNHMITLSVEQDEQTGKWTRRTAGNFGPGRSWAERREPQPDLEAPALARIRAVCEAHGLHAYHQTDPRGCPLYVSAQPITDESYSRDGVPIVS